MEGEPEGSVLLQIVVAGPVQRKASFLEKTCSFSDRAFAFSFSSADF
jgi:hypothetical protein